MLITKKKEKQIDALLDIIHFHSNCIRGDWTDPRHHVDEINDITCTIGQLLRNMVKDEKIENILKEKAIEIREKEERDY